MKKTLLACLAVLMLSSQASMLLSCGDQTEDKQPSATEPLQQDTSAVKSETDGPVYEADDLPDTLDWGGAEFHLFGWEGAANNEFFYEEEDGDIVHDAIYQRNQRVEERLNVNLEFTLQPGAYNDRASWVKTVTGSIMAGDGALDAVAGYSMSAASLAYQRLLLNLTTQEYLNFSKPWWPSSLIDEATCGGKLYFCSGDISINMINYLYATFFNSGLVTTYDLENPCQLVLDGKWTLPKMMEMSAALYSDLNGDGQKGPEDQFGYITHTTWADAFFFSCGLRTSEIGKDGLPTLSKDFGGEKTQQVLESLINFFGQDYASLIDNDYNIPRNAFLENRTLFLTAEIGFAGNYLRNATIDYGVLPMPKWDETQEGYYTVSSFPYTLYGIPNDAKNAPMSASVLEALASESYRTVSPALFETALKVKYASNNESSEMYDLIRSSNVFDIGRIFNDSMDGKTYGLFRSALNAKNKNWISTYIKEEKVLTKKYQKVIDALIAEE